MLQFLLDEHISPLVCSIVREQRSQIQIESLVEWQGGSLRGKSDDAVLTAATVAGYALVTYDLRTIPALLRAWAAQGRSHQGIIFIDEQTFRQQDLANIAAAMIRIWVDLESLSWTDRVVFASKDPAAR